MFAGLQQVAKLQQVAPRPQYVCGLYYTVPNQGQLERLYLPQVELQAHATILSTTSRTTLTQTFVNPSAAKGIKEVKYTFPLYDGVSVVGFTCHVADRTITGEVKEKEKARNDFSQAVARGETAGLFEQLNTADVFSTTVGNIPPDAKVVIKITYLGELKHDMETDGIRFTMPNSIAPRYGSQAPSLFATAHNATGNGISITVDVQMAEGSFIQKIMSPSHHISVSIGTTSLAPNAEPTFTKASTALSLSKAQLDSDFVLQIVAKNTGVPRAVLETHPTIPNQKALMATLVPKFALPSERPEIVFVCDQSGSMSGSNTTLVKQALQVFLKSLPVGVSFNICAFGSSHTFLWPRSVSYNQGTLDEAVRHIDTWDADYGGTEILRPLQATIEQRYKDVSLEVILLTDGSVWNQNAILTYLNEQISGKKAPVRVFSLGVGAGASTSLVEGVASAGNGFAQFVASGEQMDAKVVRMLKGALSPHITDYRLEVKYSSPPLCGGDENEYEIIEKVADSLTVQLDLNKDEPHPKKAISLFDPSADPDRGEPFANDDTGESRYAHLLGIPCPKIIQAPQNVPTLFAFNRTTVYLLLSPDAPQQTPTSVVLRGTSAHGPLELEFPIQILDTPGETIHQLAAKKAISELEQGRGWLSESKDMSGRLLKDLYESLFSSMVEREAVRLGVQFQVSGKWTSFVAVEKNAKDTEKSKNQEKGGWEWLEDEQVPVRTPAPTPPRPQMNTSGSLSSGLTTELFGTRPAAAANTAGSLFGQAPNPGQSGSLFGQAPAFGQAGGLFGQASTPNQGGSLFGQAHPPGQIGGIFNPARNHGQTGGLFGSAVPPASGPANPYVGASGLFGSSVTPPTQSAPLQGGGLFGGGRLSGRLQPSAQSPPNNTTASAGSGLFRQNQQQTVESMPFGQNSGNIELDVDVDDSNVLENFDFDSFLHDGHNGFGFGGSSFAGVGNETAAVERGSSGNQPLPPRGVDEAMVQRQQAAPMQAMAQQQQHSLFGVTTNASTAPSRTTNDAVQASSSYATLPATPQPVSSVQTSDAASRQDYHMQLMRLEQQNEKRLLMAKQEQDPAAASTTSTLPKTIKQASNPFGGATPARTPSSPFSLANATSRASLPGNASMSSPAPLAGRPSGNGSGGFGSVGAFGGVGNAQAFGAPSTVPPSSVAPSATPQTDDETLAFLVKLQSFEGYWEWKPELLAAIRVSDSGAEDERGALEKHVWATILVVAYFEDRLEKLKGSWELVIDKARGWLDGALGGRDSVEEAVNRAKTLV